MGNPTFYENRDSQISASHFYGDLTQNSHMHNHIEIMYLISGDCYGVCEEQEYRLESGDIFIAFPNKAHCYPTGDFAKDNEHILIIFPSSLCREFKDLFNNFTPVCPVVKAKDLDVDMKDLAIKLCNANLDKDACSRVIERGYLLSFIGKLFRKMEFVLESTSNGELLQDVLNYCNKNYKENLTLDVVAKQFNVGKYYISHILSKELKKSFTDYINGLRINDAIVMLTEEPEKSITDVAYLCGFGSTRNFNRAFQKFTNITPSEYRKINAGKYVEPVNFYIQ